MSDINKGYTFTDKSTDWASNKETAIRLNKMLDDAKINLVAGTNISISPTPDGPSISATGGAGGVTAVTGTLPIVSTGGTTPAISIDAATTSASGSMSAADKTKLDGIAAGAQVNVATNLTQGTRTTTAVPVNSSTGTAATLDIATDLLAGVMSSADKAKLDGIAANANNYSLPKATSTTLGGVELFSNTVQTVASNAVTTTSARTYGVQLNAADQMVVNVPWIDGTFANQTEKTFFAGPTSGAAAAPAFRVIASTDLPAFGSGDVSFAVAGGAGTIAADAVSNAKLADMAANTVKVNATAGAANPTDLSVGTNTVVGRVAGNIVAAQVATDQIANNAVTFAKLQDGVANTVIARAAATNGDVAGVALAASQLLGRGPAGDIAAISLGTNLSITGTTLNASGGGGGIADGATLTTGLTFPIAGLHILDTDASHDLIISPGDNLTADRTLTITTGDANRTITLTGNATLTGTNTGDQTDISGNAATVTTNANLTGPITSVGNATSVASQTGTGSTFVMQASPTLTAPALGTPTSGLLNSCTSNPNATGATARTFQARAGDVFNVKDFGATGDGSTNDTTAVQAAATAAVTRIASVGSSIPFGACLYFPAGTYRIAGTLSTIVIGSTTDSDQKSLTIIGDGPGVSHIFQTTNNAGFVDVELANRSGRLNVFDLSVFNVASTQVSSSAAFKVSVTETGNNISHPNLDVRNVYIGGIADGLAKSFTYGFDLLNIRMGSFESTMYIGNVTSGVGVRMRGVGGTPADPNNKTIDVAFNKCRFNFCEIGFEIKDSLEGVLINNCTMAGVDYGIKADYCIHLGLSNSHINSRVNAILSTGAGAGGAIDQGNIVNNSLYSEYANVEAVKGPFVRSVICGNQFLATNNNAGTVGVRLTTGSIGNNVSGNSFAWHRSSYVVVDSGATYNMVTGNMATRNTAAATNPFLDNGANNSFTNNVNEP
jgi:hypothetical protein